ncbi:hypothetical protein PSTG_07369 [Puccinia striiformis f. sp. tritici PST-78]|uniref:Uncharacterized protein n=1 Tax=Puccinia striiformis f. sp. tritici PST-78 TaxID=1165861 RepID=A0A0L0VKD2_9BASI|nr:hypothetical protein PSTG_07369 [Puccinia striiformis f. sp. tritici PST-78]
MGTELEDLYQWVGEPSERDFCRDRRPGSPRRTRKERRWRGTKPAAAQVIPRIRNNNLGRIALQERISDDTTDIVELVQNPALTLSDPKGIEGEPRLNLSSRIV